MTFNEAFRYIESFTNFERTLGNSMRPFRLDRMKILLEHFGYPEKSFKSIHISGSKGKGSTGIYIASSLVEAGFKTGLYASPHVMSYRERITIAGKEIPDAILVGQIQRIKAGIESFGADALPGQQQPTTFELLTLLAYLTFEKVGCAWAVIETGIGGRLDATNVLSPVATVHTPVELEHTEFLGTTIPLIAAEKAGIIKPGVPAFCGLQQKEAEDVFRTKAETVNAPMRFLEEEIPEITSGALLLKTGERVSIEPGMPGSFQAENAALAFLATDAILASVGVEEAERRGFIADGIRGARLPGRMELLQRDPPVMIDAAHTPSSVRRLLDSFSNAFPEKGILIFGSVLGKNPAAMAEVLASGFDSIIISTPGTFKPSDPQSVYDAFCQAHRSVELILDPKQAYVRASTLAGGSKPILVTGSFYMIAEVRPLLVGPTKAKVG
jgi:dihydrofolate synthase / folylpolyglutamate synthase